MSLTLDLEQRTLSDGTVSIRLGPRKTRIIARLSVGPINRPESGVTAEWSCLCVHISLIRKQLRDGGFPLLIARCGCGYALLAPITVTGGSAGLIIPGHMVAPLRALLWSHPDEAAAEPFLVML
jgi:hypothetical protein